MKKKRLAPTSASARQRGPRLLWANVYCLLDTASGASMMARQMLLQLLGQGYEVQIVGATIFDSEAGAARLQAEWARIQASSGKLVDLVDGPLKHRLLVTASTRRSRMTSSEEGAWFALYTQTLDQFKPDVVFYYGGQTLDLLIPNEARARGVPSVFLLVNGNYKRARWCRDVDLILTDSQATADLYAQTRGCKPVAVGAFVDPTRVVAEQHTRERILFINPTLEKGVAVVIRLAMLLEQRRPDIIFEVVESRGKWADMLRRISAAMGQPRDALSNVVVTSNTSDMRPVYGRARLLLAPSLWWDSAPRVLVEAMLNAIPAIITDHGGMPEMVQDAGIKLTLAPLYYKKPYTHVPVDQALEPLAAHLMRLYDDDALYAEWVTRARKVGQTLHHLNTSTQRLLQALKPWVDRRAGDKDAGAVVRKLHKHGMDDRPLLATEPETSQPW